MAKGYLGPPRLKARFATDGTLFGMWVACRDPFFNEVAAYSGADVLLVDAEHAPLTVEDIERIVIAAQGSPASVIVRMTGIDQVAIKHVLDSGVEGIVVPFINTAADAKRLTHYAMYPPKGNRGIGPRRAQYLTDGPWDYQQKANDDIVVLIPQIEHIDAVNNLDEICAMEGIGGLFLGPSDLSLSLGHGGEYDHPEVIAAKRRILDASRKHNLPLAVASTGIDDARYWVGEGAKLVMVASDAGLISSGMTRILDQVRT